MDQRRLLLAFLLSMLLVFAYQELVVRRYQKPVAPAPVAEAPETPDERRADDAVAPRSDAAEGDTALAASVQQGSIVTVDTDVLRARITSAGARLLALELKAYRRTVEPDSEPLQLVASSEVLPLTLDFPSGRSDAGLSYTPDRQELRLSGDERGEVVFSGEGPGGLKLEKRFSFSGNAYLFDVTARTNGATPPASVELILTPMPPDTPKGQGQEVAVGLAERRLVQKSLSDLGEEGGTTLDNTAWAGFATQYFLTAGMTDGASGQARMGVADGSPVVRVKAPVADARAEFSIYAGPKDRDVLATSGRQLERALDFGWFWFVAIPLLQALRFLQEMTGNYGVAIILLTALIKVATIPLTQTTFRNMREMQKIQPQMAKLRERFKDDQMALQKEMMELYRRHRVNPLSGCLPMLLQLPIFVGLYNALSHAIELRHAPFTLWIRDLSAPEWLVISGSIGVPVLTILMGASMFVQQWLTPQQGDPTQQKIMMFMPLLFTFMFINFPAGLVLYWLVNNVLTIGQQYVMMRSTKPGA
jgi:YidC/Oxa1 family membrane protein insertase